MIGVREVQRLAFERGVPEQMIERDYLLSWVMIALAQDTALQLLIAKGGTTLKKLYFADWRYSEDLDYTAAQMLEPESLRRDLEGATQNLDGLAGIECSLASMEPRYDTQQLRNITFYLDYIGHLRRTRCARQLKLDVTFDERVINPPIQRAVLHSYSDEPTPPVKVTSYSREEICAEKMRTLLQRTEPRDLYDVWRLLDENADYLNIQILRMTFEAKCAHRGLTVGSSAGMLSAAQVARCRAAWNRRLGE